MSRSILDLVDRSMLLEDPTRRISSGDLVKELGKIYEYEQLNIDPFEAEIAPSILSSIYEFNLKAPASLEDRIEEEKRVKRPDSKRAARKSKPYENIIPGKVAHRQVLQRQVPDDSSKFLGTRTLWEVIRLQQGTPKVQSRTRDILDPL